MGLFDSNGICTHMLKYAMQAGGSLGRDAQGSRPVSQSSEAEFQVATRCLAVFAPVAHSA